MPVWTSCVWNAACPKWVSKVGVSSNLSRNCCHCSKMRRCWWKLLTASAASISCWFVTSFSDAWCAGGSQTWLDGICRRSVFCFCRTRNSDGKCKWLVGLAQISTKLKIHPYRAWLGQHLVIWWPSLLVASHGQPRGSPKVDPLVKTAAHRRWEMRLQGGSYFMLQSTYHWYICFTHVRSTFLYVQKFSRNELDNDRMG